MNTKTYDIGDFTFLCPKKDYSLKPLTDKLYKYILVDNHGNINMIKFKNGIELDFSIIFAALKIIILFLNLKMK